MTRPRDGRRQSKAPGRGLLSLAIEQGDWDAAAVCLLLGVARAARSLPPGAIEALLQLLSPPARGRKRRAPRDGGGMGHDQRP